MSSFTRTRAFTGLRRAGRLSLLVVVAAGATACSADIGRFDFPVMGYNSPSQQTTGAVPPPLPSVPMRQNAGVAPPPPVVAAPADNVSVAPLPGAAARPVAALPPPPVNQAAPKLAPAAPVPPAGAQTVEVQQGDSIYAIARRHGISIAELMSANSLTNPTIRPGQRLIVPPARRPVARTVAKKADAPAGGPVAAAPGSAAPAKALKHDAAPQPAPADWTGAYTVQAGDSLYGIARRHHIPLARLQEVNGITEPTKVRPGHVLKVPAAAAATSAPPAPAVPQPAPVAAAPAPRPAAKHVAPPAAAGIAPKSVTILNPSTGGAPQPHADGAAAPAAPAADATGGATGSPLPGAAKAEPKRVAALNPEAKAASGQPQTANDASPAPVGATGTPKFRWPVKGRVITAFGPLPNNAQNDGINISVPSGAEVTAAEAGIVAYAGSELKGYGNLVLIRHDGNWVTAYAHNDQILVKRGDRVRAGQPIAKAGRSGTVDQPQVHFEIRQGSRPVDPIPLLERQ